MEKENSFSSTSETQIYKIKKIAKTNMWLNLMHLIPQILLTLLFVLPIINMDLIFAEANFSMLDVLISTPSSQTLKGQAAASLGADILGIPYNEYSNFFLGLFTHFSGNTILYYVKTILIRFLCGFAIISFVIWSIRSIVLIIPTILNANVETPLRFADKETFDSLFYQEQTGYVFDFEEQKRKKDLKGLARRLLRKLFINWLIGMLILVGSSVLPHIFCIIHVGGLDLVSISPIFSVIIFLLIFLLFVGQIVEYFYSIKHAGTLECCKRLKRMLKYKML